MLRCNEKYRASARGPPGSRLRAEPGPARAYSRQIPDIGFSHGPASSNRHQSVRCGAFRGAFEVKTNPAMPRPGSTFAPPFGNAAHRNATPPQRTEHRLRQGHLRPEVLARDGLCCPALPRLAPHPPVRRTPVHFPAEPVIGPVLDIQRVILSALLTFRTFTTVLSRIATFSLRRETRCVLLSSSASTLAIG